MDNRRFLHNSDGGVSTGYMYDSLSPREAPLTGHSEIGVVIRSQPSRSLRVKLLCHSSREIYSWCYRKMRVYTAVHRNKNVYEELFGGCYLNSYTSNTYMYMYKYGSSLSIYIN